MTYPSPTATYRKTIYDAISPKRPELSARGKSVLITGAGTGIGAETARRFAEAGASRIAILGRREQPLAETKASIAAKFPDVEVFAVSADVTQKSEVDAAFARFAAGRPINVLVSNAGIGGPAEPVHDVDPAAFLGLVQDNLGGQLLVAQAFLRFAAPAAVAVVVSTGHAHANFIPGFAAYSVSKMAIFRLWDSVAFANPALAVFHVHPGVIDTPGSRAAGDLDAFGPLDDGKEPNVS